MDIPKIGGAGGPGVGSSGSSRSGALVGDVVSAPALRWWLQRHGPFV
jgi:hypothetical protein